MHWIGRSVVNVRREDQNALLDSPPFTSKRTKASDPQSLETTTTQRKSFFADGTRRGSLLDVHLQRRLRCGIQAVRWSLKGANWRNARPQPGNEIRTRDPQLGKLMLYH